MATTIPEQQSSRTTCGLNKQSGRPTARESKTKLMVAEVHAIAPRLSLESASFLHRD